MMIGQLGWEKNRSEHLAAMLDKTTFLATNAELILLYIER